MSGTSQAAGCDRFPGARSGSCALDEVGDAVAACVGGYDYLTRQVAALDPQRRATRAWRPTTPSAAKPPGYGLARKWPASRAWTVAQSCGIFTYATQVNLRRLEYLPLLLPGNIIGVSSQRGRLMSRVRTRWFVPVVASIAMILAQSATAALVATPAYAAGPSFSATDYVTAPAPSGA